MPADKRVYLGSASVSRDGIERSIAYPGDMRQIYVTALCGECNAKWMEPIEVAAVPAFAELMRGERVPTPASMLPLAHWAVVFSALSSELYPALDIPRSHRRAIREATSLPPEYSVFVVWTSDYLASVETNLYRSVSSPKKDNEPDIVWVNFLQSGPAAVITATPDLSGRVARVLAESAIHSALGFIGETLVYVPDGWATAMTTGPRPTQQEVHDLGPTIGGSGQLATAPNGQDMLDLTGGLQSASLDMSFDFAGRLHDYRELRVPAEPES